MTHARYYTQLDTPLGSLLLVSTREALSGLYFAGKPHVPAISANWVHRPEAEIFALAQRQLNEFTAGERREFDLPVELSGTDFQQAVWEVIRGIPFGGTISYSTLASRVGRPSAIRAAGMATGQNPVSWIVPCHRVVGKTGKMTGYAGGLGRKTALLAFETAQKSGQQVPLAAQAEIFK